MSFPVFNTFKALKISTGNVFPGKVNPTLLPIYAQMNKQFSLADAEDCAKLPASKVTYRQVVNFVCLKGALIVNYVVKCEVCQINL